MFLIIVVILVVLAFGGFGHTGYRQGWYGSAQPTTGRGNWGGGIFGIILIILLLYLLFGGGHSYFVPATTGVAQ